MNLKGGENNSGDKYLRAKVLGKGRIKKRGDAKMINVQMAKPPEYIKFKGKVFSFWKKEAGYFYFSYLDRVVLMDEWGHITHEGTVTLRRKDQ